MTTQVYSLGGVYPTRSDTSPQFKLGQRVWSKDGAEFIYCQTNGTNAAGAVNRIPVNHLAAKITTSNAARGDRVGVAMTTMADTEYGWFQIYGEGVASVLASAAANTRLNTTATAGSPDDDGTSSSKQIQGLYLTAANGGSTANTACVLNYPFVDATL